MYLLDDCDHAGVWVVEMDVAQLRIGETLCKKDILEKFNSHIHVFDNQQLWFIPAFIEFQYGTLNPNVNAHKSVISILQKKKLLKKYEQFINSSLTVKDKDKDKDKDKAKDKDSECLLEFDKARVSFPGTVRGNVVEFTNFKKKHKNWKEIIPLLLPAIIRQKQWRKEAGTDFRPNWKIFTTWINNSSWEDSVDIAEATEDNKACVNCHAAYVEGKHKFTMNNVTNQKEYRCAECRGAK